MTRCPKCKADGENIILREHWTDHVIEFVQNADGTVQPEGILREGSPAMVRGVCACCGHRWKLRGVSQITELVRGESDAG